MLYYTEGIHTREIRIIQVHWQYINHFEFLSSSGLEASKPKIDAAMDYPW